MDTLEDIKIAKLKNGNEIRLNDDPISIEKVSNGKIITTLNIPYPPEGYGGGSIYVSPSEKYILFVYYSGQSEEAFTLLKNNNEFTIVYESGYLFGEAASYCFSEKEDHLIQGLPCTCSEWWLLWTDDEVEKDKNGNLYFSFGYINILKIQSSKFEKHEVIIHPYNGWQPEQEEYDPLLSPQFIQNNVLSISWPWGNDNLEFPITGEIAINIEAQKENA